MMMGELLLRLMVELLGLLGQLLSLRLELVLGLLPSGRLLLGGLTLLRRPRYAAGPRPGSAADAS